MSAYRELVFPINRLRFLGSASVVGIGLSAATEAGTEGEAIEHHVADGARVLLIVTSDGQLRVHLEDQHDLGRPIAGAIVRIVGPDGPAKPAATGQTDAHGEAALGDARGLRRRDGDRPYEVFVSIPLSDAS